MANSTLSHEAVKAIEDKLECSPSAHDASGNYGGAPNLNVTAKNGGVATVLSTMGKKTTEFQMSDRGRALPNYKGQFAKHAQDV